MNISNRLEVFTQNSERYNKYLSTVTPFYIIVVHCGPSVTSASTIMFEDSTLTHVSGMSSDKPCTANPCDHMSHDLDYLDNIDEWKNNPEFYKTLWSCYKSLSDPSSSIKERISAETWAECERKFGRCRRLDAKQDQIDEEIKQYYERKRAKSAEAMEQFMDDPAVKGYYEWLKSVPEASEEEVRKLRYFQVSTNNTPPPCPRILSLDGGGVRGISSLFILRDLMGEIGRCKSPTTTPLPCEYFDLIAGTSTGGLIALMLGRLRMVAPTPKCAC